MKNEKEIVRRRLRFRGTVQGVGFRWRARHAASLAGASGWIRNNQDGSVSLELQGTEAQIEETLRLLRQSRYLRIDSVETRELPLRPDERGFSVRTDDDVFFD